MERPLTRLELQSELETALSYIANPPAPGSAGEASLDRCLAAIGAYAASAPTVAREQRSFSANDDGE